MKKIFDWFFRRFFCPHRWVTQSRSQCDIINNEGKMAGQVTLTLVNCTHCKKDEVWITDKTDL
jgi:hypothetical protein